MTFNTLYTLRYQDWEPDAITALLDIRLVPSSPNPQWRYPAFEQRLRNADVTSQYQRLQGSGNKNFRNGGPIVLKDPAPHVIPIQQLLTMTVVLMYGCCDHTQCHRTVAAEYLASQISGIEMVHLYPESPEIPLDSTINSALH